MKRLLAYVLVTVCSALLGLPTGAAARNNLNLIPGKGVHFGIVQRGGPKIGVTLERVGKNFPASFNDNFLQIHDVPAGAADARPVFDGTDDGTPFAEAFPQGAYELIDANHDFFAGRGCVQQKAATGAGWDNGRVYCDKSGVEQIRIAGSPGNDALDVGPDVTVPVRFKCHGAQAPCGRSCLLPESYTCCDPTLPGYGPCYVATGGTCGVDPTYCETLP